MSQQRRPNYLYPLGTLLVSLLIGMFLFARKRFSRSTPSKTITTHSAETSPEDALTYWTADKMRDAKAAPLPVVNEQKQGKRPPHSSHSEQN